MTPIEFATWMKGFVKAVDDYTITPKHWSDIKEILKTVDDTPTSYTVKLNETSGVGVNNTAQITNMTYNQDVLSTNTAL